MKDVIVVGAGPGGVQASYFLSKRGRDYVCLEAAAGPGNFFAKFPRHRFLISINKKYTGFTDPEINMRWDWNSLLVEEEDYKKHKMFPEFTDDYFPNADFVVEYLEEFVKTFNLNVVCDSRVVKISKDNNSGIFTLVCGGKNGAGKVYQTKCVIMATGFESMFKPNCPGDDLIEDYTDMSVDPAEFRGQQVLIIGKGNSAFETADNIIHTTAVIHVCSPNPLQLAWKSHYIGHLRAVNNNLLDTYQLKAQNAVLDCTIKRISKRSDNKYAVDVEYTHAMGETETLIYDRVLNCTGFKCGTSHFDQSAMPVLAKKNKFPKLTNAWESVNVRGMFFAGVLSHERDFKKTTSGFIHGFRHAIRTLMHLVEDRMFAVPYPSVTFPATAENLKQHILARLARNGGMWQEFGFLADCAVVRDGKVTYYDELPRKYIAESSFGTNSHYYVITLEFGKICGDPFAIDRKPVPDQAAVSTFLHPVVRRYEASKLLGELHLLEDLYTDWTHPEKHIKPLARYLEDSFAGRKLPIMGQAMMAKL